MAWLAWVRRRTTASRFCKGLTVPLPGRNAYCWSCRHTARAMRSERCLANSLFTNIQVEYEKAQGTHVAQGTHNTPVKSHPGHHKQLTAHPSLFICGGGETVFKTKGVTRKHEPKTCGRYIHNFTLPHTLPTIIAVIHDLSSNTIPTVQAKQGSVRGSKHLSLSRIPMARGHCPSLQHACACNIIAIDIPTGPQQLRTARTTAQQSKAYCPHV